MARLEAAPALFRLLSDSALSRAALGACGFPLALLDAAPSARVVTYVNPAFEKFFGFGEREAIGHSLAALLFRGDEALLQRVLSEAPSGCQLKAWGRTAPPVTSRSRSARSAAPTGASPTGRFPFPIAASSNGCAPSSKR